jgi:mono/diheme cytochrome c family protein
VRLHPSAIGLIALNALILVGAGVRPAVAQRHLTPPVVISSLSGGDLFRFYCTSCHGSDGKGDGPVAATLKTPPPDLTRIAARNGGHFPSEELQGFVAGNERPIAAHGSREMPVWGPIFQSLEPHDRLTRIRIESVVKFLESIQKP